MARKRKHVKRSHRRSSRRSGIRGIGTGLMGLGTDVVAIGIGMVGAKYLQNKLLANQNDLIKTGAPVVAGIVLHQFIKSPLVKSVGTGMVLSPVVSFGTDALGIGDIMNDISPADASIMENITVGAVNIAENVNIADDITVGSYGEYE